MPLHDFGTVRVFAGTDQVDVFLPRADTDVKSVLKRLKGRWVPDRKCWRVVPRFAKTESSRIVAEIEKTLLAAAPKGWEAALPTISRFACVTRKYELRVGAGGIRLSLPPGHPSDYAMRKIPGAQKEAESWLVPAGTCVLPEIKPVIARIVKEDRELFRDALTYVRGRSISGTIHVTDEDARSMGLVPDGVVFADLSFMKTAEPQIPPAPVLEYGFKVRKAARSGDEVEARLDYLEDDAAYAEAKARLILPQEERTPALNVLNVKAKWAYKRR